MDNSIEKIKHNTDLSFSIIRCSDKFFVVYRDEEKLQVGKGTEGKVKYVKNLNTNEIFACKIMEYRESALKEKFFLEKTKALRASLTRDKIDFLKTYLIMDLGPLSLDKQLPSMSKDLCLLASYRMLEEIIKLHNEYEIAHGDYGCSNVLFDPSNGKMQIIDFGKSYDLTKDNNPEGKKKFDILIAVLSIRSIFQSNNIKDADIDKILDIISEEIFGTRFFDKFAKNPDQLSQFISQKDCSEIKSLNSISFDKVLNLLFDKISDTKLKEYIRPNKSNENFSLL